MDTITHAHSGRDHADVVVVGARAAGATTAMLAARAGHDVLVVDRARFPSDTLSTHAIARTGMVALRRWGLLDDLWATGAPPLRRVVFHVEGERIDRPVTERVGVAALAAPRRHVLDPFLLDAAERSGARVRTGFTVDRVRFDDAGRAIGVEGHDDTGEVVVDARIVVGADGLRSRVARDVAAPITEQRPTLGACHYAYFAGDWPAMELLAGDGAAAGIFPTHDGEACVWVCLPAPRAEELRRRHDSPVDAFASMVGLIGRVLADRLHHAERRSPVRGMIGMPNHLRRPVGPGWILAGDAAYHRDAVSGHGISDAFRDAELTAETLDRVLRGDDESAALAEHHARRDAEVREIFDITCELATFPSASRFTELQMRLSGAIEAEAARMAERPLPGAALAA